MPVPKYNEMFGVFLKALSDGEVHDYKDVKKYVIDALHLTQADLEELLPSGNESTFTNRIGWARTYLKKACLIESPSRAHFVLTAAGKAALPDADIIDNAYLEKYDAYRQFISESSGRELTGNDTVGSVDQSPLEQLESSFEALNATLAGDLLDEVMKLSPAEFEKLVVALLLKMGYGNGIEDAGRVTPVSNDAGIDGIIKEDQLGFSSICIQAKQWAVDRSIDRPEIQKFAGALQGQLASKGLFITTAKFSSGAREYAENLHGSKIVLIDGNHLTRLMIKHNLGVSVQTTYEIKRIDTDFFSGISDM